METSQFIGRAYLAAGMSHPILAPLEMYENHPLYREILKTILKSQIQMLVDQLSTQIGEETVLLTASLEDGHITDIGTECGRDFLKGHGDIKSQFMGFCIKRHFERQPDEPSSILGQRTILMKSSKHKVIKNLLQSPLCPVGSPTQDRSSRKQQQASCSSPPLPNNKTARKQQVPCISPPLQSNRNSQKQQVSCNSPSLPNDRISRKQQMSCSSSPLALDVFESSDKFSIQPGPDLQLDRIDGAIDLKSGDDTQKESIDEMVDLSKENTTLDAKSLLTSAEVEQTNYISRSELRDETNRMESTSRNKEEKSSTKENQPMINQYSSLQDQITSKRKQKAPKRVKVESAELATMEHQDQSMDSDNYAVESPSLAMESESSNLNLALVSPNLAVESPTFAADSSSFLSESPFTAMEEDGLGLESKEIKTELNPSESEKYARSNEYARSVDIKDELHELPVVTNEAGISYSADNFSPGYSGFSDTDIHPKDQTLWNYELCRFNKSCKSNTQGCLSSDELQVLYRNPEVNGLSNTKSIVGTSSKDLACRASSSPNSVIDGVLVHRGKGRLEKMLRCELCGKVCRTSNMARHKKRYCLGYPKVRLVFPQ